MRGFCTTEGTGLIITLAKMLTRHQLLCPLAPKPGFLSDKKNHCNHGFYLVQYGLRRSNADKRRAVMRLLEDIASFFQFFGTLIISLITI